MSASLSANQFGALHRSLAEDGGFTVSPFTGEPVTSGISVAPDGNELRIPAADTSPGALRAYHESADNQQRFGRGASFGGWRDDNSGDDFIDTPTVYEDTPSGQSRARNQMLKSNQIAAYNIGPGHTLINPFHPENKSLDIVSSDDSPEQQAAWRDMPRRQTKGSRVELRGQSFS